MHEIFQAESYSFSPLSIPFIGAGLATLLVTLYVSITRGAPALRGSMILICIGLLPFSAGFALVGSTRDPATAELLFRISICLLPFASTGVLLLLLALSHQLARFRLLTWFALGSSAVLTVVCVATDLVINGVWTTPSGLLYFTVPVNGVSQLHVLAIGGWVALGVLLVWRRIGHERSLARRRQLKGSMLAFSICVFGLVDVPMGYEVGWFPVNWVFLTAGLLLALRLLIRDDLLHARDSDRTVPAAVLYVVLAAAGIWLAIYSAGPGVSPIAAAGLVAGVFLTLRLGIALISSMSTQASRKADSPLDRALEKFASSVQNLRTEGEIGAAALELIDLGLGADDVEFMLPSREDYSWERLDGETVAEAATPDPLLLMWLSQHHQPLPRDDLETLRLGDLREPLERLFEMHKAEVMVPLMNRDEIVGMITIGALRTERSLRREELTFLTQLQEHLASALVYARMYREATSRVEVDKEVGLAAAVQSAFVPDSKPLRRGQVIVCGMYEPASKCGGDWWSVHELPDGRVLVLIGDVTGHGIAAAMVTAAAKGCYDVAQRLMGDDIDLPRLLELLDASVRRAGGTDYYMTCFATLLDPENNSVTYANAGHVVPYLCRPQGDGGMHLDALVARGNPLGTGEPGHYKSSTHDLESGDVLIWYTDGIVECTNPARAQFGDRRMQRMLRKLESGSSDAVSIRDKLSRAAIAFQEGHPADDDITLVVGCIL